MWGSCCSRGWRCLLGVAGGRRGPCGWREGDPSVMPGARVAIQGSAPGGTREGRRVQGCSFPAALTVDLLACSGRFPRKGLLQPRASAPAWAQ